MRQQIIVSVEIQCSRSGHIMQMLGFGFQNAVPVMERLQMGVSDDSIHHIRGPNDFAQLLHLTEVRNSHFHHSHLMFRLNPGNGHGNAQIVVEVLLRFQYPIPGAQYGGHHFFHGGFSHAAGNANHGNPQGVPICLGNVRHGFCHIRHHHARSGNALGHMGHQHTGSAGSQRFFHKCVTVHLFSGQGGKEISRRNQPAVDDQFIGLQGFSALRTGIRTAAERRNLF